MGRPHGYRPLFRTYYAQRGILSPIKGPFEDFSINLPHDPDTYLKNQYGDYWVIPPEADREKHYSVGFCLDCAAEEQKKDGAQDQ